MKIKIYKITILSLVLYGLREEHRLSVVLRRIFGPKRDAITRRWRKLYNEELHILYTSKNNTEIIKSRNML
jgi:hypothetical protein